MQAYITLCVWICVHIYVHVYNVFCVNVLWCMDTDLAQSQYWKKVKYTGRCTYNLRNMYIHVYLCMHFYRSEIICTYIYSSVHMYLCIHIHIKVPTNDVRTPAHKHTYMCAYNGICICICMDGLPVHLGWLLCAAIPTSHPTSILPAPCPRPLNHGMRLLAALMRTLVNVLLHAVRLACPSAQQPRLQALAGFVCVWTER